ncbi:LPS assembly lipoprotein LptE [Halalkalibaculum sp. DA3122]|uniref:LPS assembly lipoprotein LptE n=1 Tax=unclassified Halalkalibaculum TaxID=2964617 RepID=UPI0037546D76
MMNNDKTAVSSTVQLPDASGRPKYIPDRMRKIVVLLMLCILPFSLAGCYSYSFTGTSIPEGVNSIYIPFFADQSNSSIGNLSDQLNQVLIERFVNQTRLQLANSRSDADAVLEGQIINYTNQPFSVTGEEETSQNQVTVTVRATYQYTSEEQPEWNQQFSGQATYDPNENPIEGEEIAAAEAIEQVVNNMFNDAVSDW